MTVLSTLFIPRTVGASGAMRFSYPLVHRLETLLLWIGDRSMLPLRWLFRHGSWLSTFE